MLFGQGLAHIRADFAYDLLRQVEAENFRRREINPGQTAEVLAHIHRESPGRFLLCKPRLVGVAAAQLADRALGNRD